jgi:hypothetical protein
LRRSELDAPNVAVEVSGRLDDLEWLWLTGVPRLQDSDGRPLQSRHRERFLLAALHALGAPVVFRFEQVDGHLRVGVGSPRQAGDMGVLQAVASHYPGAVVSRDARLPRQARATGYLAICGTPQPLPERVDVDLPDIGSLFGALRGRNVGLTIQCLPIARTACRGRAAGLAAQVGEWSVHLRHSVDVSSQQGQTVSRALRREHIDRAAQLALEVTETLLNGAVAGEAEGLWRWSGLLWADTPEALSAAAAVVKSLYTGPDAGPEPMRTVAVPALTPGDRDLAMDGRIVLGLGGVPLGTPLPSGHLAALIRFPQRSFPGFSSAPAVAFSTAGPSEEARPVIEVGEVLDRGCRTGATLGIPRDELTGHGLVVGMTSSGKTNTCMALLRSLAVDGIPGLVIEPAKTEYRALSRFPELAGRLHVFTLGLETVSPFRLNPFACPAGYPVSTHVDFVKSVFSTSFAMYGPMPHILEEAVVRVYEKRGWDLARNSNRHAAAVADPALLFPTLEDLLAEIDPVVRSIGYADELTMDIRGALKTRIKSLLTGAKGLMLGACRSTPLGDLLSRPTVLELSALGDDDEKALLMGLLLVGIYEHRQAEERGGSELRHVTLIEEAHRILKNVPTAQNPEIANVAGKAVETFNNILAEIRAYGEGIIISEQIPSKLSPDAIKNTNLKIVHRLHAADDRAVMGDCMVLTEAQKGQLARLPSLSAAVFGAGVSEAVVVAVPPSKPEFEAGFEEPTDRAVAASMHDYHERTSAARERFPGCKLCLDKCSRVIDAQRILDDPDSREFAFARSLVLQWSVLARPQQSTIARARGAAERRCLAAHAAHRFVTERMAFYGLDLPDRLRLEESLTAALEAEPESDDAVAVFVEKWLPILKRKRAEQERQCRDCALPVCIGHEVAAAVRDGRLAREFEQCRSAKERVVFLERIAERSGAAGCEALRSHFGYCYFVRHAAETGVGDAHDQYERTLQEVLS